jgi:hypothetical protein
LRAARQPAWRTSSTGGVEDVPSTPHHNWEFA